MTDVNSVVIIGRLTRDLNAGDQREFAYTPNGQARANISIAVNRSRKNGDQWVDEANYFNVTIWGKTAENLKPYLTKGKQIAVEGYLKQERWQDRETGKTRERISIVANNVQLFNGKTESNPRQNGNYQTAQSSMQPQYDYSDSQYSDGDSFQEDIPF